MRNSVLADLSKLDSLFISDSESVTSLGISEFWILSSVAEFDLEKSHHYNNFVSIHIVRLFLLKNSYEALQIDSNSPEVQQLLTSYLKECGCRESLLSSTPVFSVFVLFARSIPYSILLFLKEYLYWTALSRLHWLARRPKSTRSVNEAASAFPHKRRYSLFGYWININKSDINYKTDFISGHWDKLSSIIGNNFSKAITFIHYPLLSSQYPIPWDVISNCSKINNTVSPSKQF